jgi:hypothetical protein
LGKQQQKNKPPSTTKHGKNKKKNKKERKGGRVHMRPPLNDCAILQEETRQDQKEKRKQSGHVNAKEKS